MFWWLLISAPLLLLLLALCLPITATLAVSSDQDLLIDGHVRWALWQIKQIHFAPFAVGETHQENQLQPKSKAKVKRSEPRPSASQETIAPGPQARKSDRLPVSWATARPLLHKYLPRCWRALHIRCLYGHFRLAVDDPAYYGWIYAFLGATQLPRQPISLQVDLNTDVAFQADAKWRSRLYPIQWLWLVACIGLEPPVRSIWWSKLRKKGERKHARPQSVYRPAGKPHFQQDSHRRSYHSG
ncbi:MAG TPA: hypothetical protein DDZ53_03060 [Firmicutes bacterium]|nr:hypothetical protein [Bacillota bacterium]